MMNTKETPGRILIFKNHEVDLLNMTDLVQSEGYQFPSINDGRETSVR